MPPEQIEFTVDVPLRCDVRGLDLDEFVEKYLMPAFWEAAAKEAEKFWHK